MALDLFLAGESGPIGVNMQEFVSSSDLPVNLLLIMEISSLERYKSDQILLHLIALPSHAERYFSVH